MMIKIPLQSDPNRVFMKRCQANEFFKSNSHVNILDSTNYIYC